MENNNQWTWICPLCGKEITEDYTVDEVKEYIGATHDCPECGGTVQIMEDLTCSDFGEYLVKAYAEMGVTVSKEDACNSYIEV